MKQYKNFFGVDVFKKTVDIALFNEQQTDSLLITLPAWKNYNTSLE